MGAHHGECCAETEPARVQIAHDKGPLTEDEINDLLLAPCTLTIGTGEPITGIARAVEISEALEGRVAVYDIFLVPAMWLLTVSKLCRLYQKMSVKDMAGDILARYQLGGHFDLRIKGATPREFVIQYQESDWDFLQRWFEHEGYFYWFEHSADGEKLIVADANDGTTPLSGNTTLPHRELAGLVRTEESVFEWRGVQRRIPAVVVLKDYNEQKPLLVMAGQADVDKKRGFGVVFEYGDNFDSPAEGTALAKKRAERFQTERLTLSGVTDSVRFHVGHWFELADHFDGAQNRKYLITSVYHRLGPVAEEGGGASAAP